MDTFNSVVSIMDSMVIILVIAAVILGIVVLYNLGIMSYVERSRELANIMKSATNSINNLVTSTNNMSARIQSGMNRLNASAELSNYQQQQTNRELSYMNMMNTLHFYS